MHLLNTPRPARSTHRLRRARLAVPQRLHLAALRDDARLEALADLVVVRRGAILRDELPRRASLVVLRRNTFPADSKSGSKRARYFLSRSASFLARPFLDALRGRPSSGGRERGLPPRRRGRPRAGRDQTDQAPRPCPGTRATWSSSTEPTDVNRRQLASGRAISSSTSPANPHPAAPGSPCASTPRRVAVAVGVPAPNARTSRSAFARPREIRHAGSCRARYVQARVVDVRVDVLGSLSQ